MSYSFINQCSQSDRFKVSSATSAISDCHVISLSLLHPFIKKKFNSNQSGFGQQHKQSCISFILFIYIFCQELHDCQYMAIDEISSRNHLWREDNDVMVQMLTLPFIFENKCPLPWTCDEFHRQETFCTKDFLFFNRSLF